MERFHHSLVSPSELARALARQRAVDRCIQDYNAEWAKIRANPGAKYLIPIPVPERMRSYFFDWNQIKDTVPRLDLSTWC